MSLSTPTTVNPSLSSDLHASDPIRPPDPVTIAMGIILLVRELKKFLFVKLDTNNSKLHDFFP